MMSWTMTSWTIPGWTMTSWTAPIGLEEITWENSGYLYLIPVVLTLIPLYAAFTKELFTPLILRALALSAVLAALANPTLNTVMEKQTLTALVDISKSVPDAALETFSKELSKFSGLGGDNKLTVYTFSDKLHSKKSFAVLPNDASDTLKQLKRIRDNENLGETNIIATFKEFVDAGIGDTVLLLTDGMQTSGNVSSGNVSSGNVSSGDVITDIETSKLKPPRIYTLTPPESLFVKQGLELSFLHAPLAINAEERAEVKISVKNNLPTRQLANVELYVDDKKLHSQNLEVMPASEKVTTAVTSVLEGGLHRLRAVLTRGDKSTAVLHRSLSVKSKAKVLLLSGTEDDERVLAKLLNQRGFTLESIIGDGRKQIPMSLASYSLVMFNNIAERQLPKGFLKEVEMFASQGGGVILLGGAHSFGLGGYIDTPLEKISPLKFVPPQTTKRRLSSAIILLIDKSRSMAAENKIEGAKKAAYASVQSMNNEDQIGVIGFDTTPFVVIRLAPARDVKEQADRRLRNLTAAGQTNLLPALSLAQKTLISSDASRKHIILLSDGKFPPSEGDYQDIMAELSRAGITLSTVALGVEADAPLLKMMSNIAKGTFYHTLDPNRLPEIFVEDVKVSTGEKTLKEEDNYAVVVGPHGTVSTSLNRFPAVRGFVETLPKKGSNMELITQKNDTAYPILSSWLYDKGRVIAYTSDANGRWSAPWLQWPEFSTFWTEIANATKSQNKDRELDFDFRYQVTGSTLSLDLAVYDNNLATEPPPSSLVRITTPRSELRTVSLEPQAKGRFTAKLANIQTGDYVCDISYGNTKFPSIVMTVPETAFGEQIGEGVNKELLSQLAARSGGLSNPTPDQITWKKKSLEEKKHLFPPLAFAAFFLILLEAFLREVVLKRRSVSRPQEASTIYGTRWKMKTVGK